MIIIEGVGQTVVHHGVDDLVVVHPGAPAGGGDGVGGRGHVLGAAGHDDVGITGDNGAGTLNDALHAGAADHAHGVGGDLNGNPGLEGGLAGHVLAQAGGQNAAKHDLIHILGGNIGALERFLDDNGTHLGSRNVLQGPAERADSGTAAVHNIDFSHGTNLHKLSIFVFCFPILMLRGLLYMIVP